MKIKSNFIFFVSLFLIQPILFAEDNESIKTDILFLKIPFNKVDFPAFGNPVNKITPHLYFFVFNFF